MNEWTIMFYLNGKNDLEPIMFDIFSKIAAVGSSDKIKFVVEFGRREVEHDCQYGDWGTTLLFCVDQGMPPEPGRALENLGQVDMGHGATIAHFVGWGRDKYPAKKYMLVIVDHGSGWRLSKTALSPTLISLDDDFGHSAYNRDIQNYLFDILKGESLDVIGFDACCMAMIETAYAMRGVARVMVASEDIVYNFFSMGSWLDVLAAYPTMDGVQLGKEIVKSYQALGDKEATLSAVDLSISEALANTITEFVTLCIPKLGQEKPHIKLARQQCSAYAQAHGLWGVDCFRWFEKFSQTTSDSELRQKAKDVCDQIEHSFVIANYHTHDRDDASKFGSHGVAIYYPATPEDYQNDDSGQYYSRSNRFKPVEFVEKHDWVLFLQALGIVAGKTIRVAFFDLGRTLIGAARDWLPGAQMTLSNLRLKCIRLGLISNTKDLSRTKILELLPRDFDIGLFEDDLVLFSSEVHVEKPDPRIFQLAIERAGVNPRECLFCADESDHTLVAKHAGMQTVLVQELPGGDIGKLVEKLESAGLVMT